MPNLRPLPTLVAAAAMVALAPAAHAAPMLAGAAGLKPRPDLVVSKLTAARAGARITVADTTRNAGRRRSGASRTAYWLSSDAAKGAGDTRLGARAVKPQRARRGAAATTVLVLPAGIRAGTYRVIACADERNVVREARETNNCAVAAGRVVVAGAAPGPVAPGAPPAPAPPAVAAAAGAPAPDPAPAPVAAPAPAPAPVPLPGGDLAAADVSDPPATAKEGSTFKLADTTRNASGEKAAASTTRFYLSPDSRTSLDDRMASEDDPRTSLPDRLMGGHRDVPALEPGAASAAEAHQTVVTVPVGTRPGTYHVLACADDRAAVLETTEGDNCVVATHPEGGKEVPTPITILAEAQLYRVDTFADVFDDPDEAEDEATLARTRGAFCSITNEHTIASVPAAVASARRQLEERAPGALAKFAATPEFTDSAKAQAAAGAAVTAGVPGAALAALLRAHELEPARASHLVNAAAVASTVGMPSEALAMLDGARRLDGPGRPAMGLPHHAVELANRGQALAMLGRRDQADHALTAALAAEPLLAEAQTSRSATTVCKAGVEPAAKLLRAGRSRQGRKPIDSSFGRASLMRDLELPALPKQAAAWKSYYQKQATGLHAEIVARNGRVDHREAAVAAKREAWSAAQRRRHHAIFGLLYAVEENDTDVADKREIYEDKVAEARETRDWFWTRSVGDESQYRIFFDQASADCVGSKEPKCFERRMNEQCRPALRIAHQEWLDEMQEAHVAGRTYYRALSKRLSGIAVNLSDPDAHAIALEHIGGEELSAFATLNQAAQQWTHSVNIYADHCVEVPDPPNTNVSPAAGPTESEAACSGLLKGISGTFALGEMKLKVSCESIQQSFSYEAVPWVKAFAEVTYDIRSQKLTVVGGTKGEIEAGVAKGTFKSGIYVTADRHGVSDVGWRVGPSATVGKGPVEFGVFKDEIDLSFVGAVSSTFGQP